MLSSVCVCGRGGENLGQYEHGTMSQDCLQNSYYQILDTIPPSGIGLKWKIPTCFPQPWWMEEAFECHRMGGQLFTLSLSLYSILYVFSEHQIVKNLKW